MMKYSNCEMTAANITLRLKAGMACYRIYGYTFRTKREEIECIVLQPADRRKPPVFYAPVDEVATLEVNF
jgi:hypothetical protein